VNGKKKLPRQRRVSQSNWETAGCGERIWGNTNVPTIDEEKSGGLTSLRNRWGKGQSSTNRTGQEQPRDTCGTRLHEKDAPSSGGLQADLPTVQTSSKLRFHRGSMDPILRLRIPVLTVSRVNGSDFTHLGTSFHRKLFNCFLKTVKTGTQMCKI
jgi:hypothetical protein